MTRQGQLPTGCKNHIITPPKLNIYILIMRFIRIIHISDI